MRSFATALLTSLALLASAPGNTAAPAGDVWPAKALELALAWVTHHTSYAEVPPVRAVIVLAPAAMATQASKAYPTRPASDVFAVYSCADRTMYFSSEADLDNPLVFSFLVREVVRYAQCEHETAAGTRCELAREPYWAQAKFIRATPALFASQGTQMSAAQAEFLDRVALDVDKLAERACAEAARQR